MWFEPGLTFMESLFNDLSLIAALTSLSEPREAIRGVDLARFPSREV